MCYIIYRHIDEKWVKSCLYTSHKWILWYAKKKTIYGWSFCTHFIFVKSALHPSPPERGIWSQCRCRIDYDGQIDRPRAGLVLGNVCLFVCLKLLESLAYQISHNVVRSIHVCGWVVEVIIQYKVQRYLWNQHSHTSVEPHAVWRMDLN